MTLSDGCLKYPRDCFACVFRGKGANSEGAPEGEYVSSLHLGRRKGGPGKKSDVPWVL